MYSNNSSFPSSRLNLVAKPKFFKICHADIKKSNFSNFFFELENSNDYDQNTSWTLLKNPRYSIEASGLILRKLEKVENFQLFGVIQKPFLQSNLFKTHRQTQRMHSWIGLGLRNVKKLVPRQTNSQILSYDHFSGQNLRKIFDHSSPRFSLQPNYSKSGDRLYESFSTILRHDLYARGKPSTDVHRARDP